MAGDALVVAAVERRRQAKMRGAGLFPKPGLLRPIRFGSGAHRHCFKLAAQHHHYWVAAQLVVIRWSKLWSGRGPRSQKRDLVGTEESREALVECDDAIASGTVGLVPNDAVGKVAAAREHRDPRLSGGSLDFD
jgi:hypothetical protein